MQSVAILLWALPTKNAPSCSAWICRALKRFLVSALVLAGAICFVADREVCEPTLDSGDLPCCRTFGNLHSHWFASLSFQTAPVSHWLRTLTRRCPRLSMSMFTQWTNLFRAGQYAPTPRSSRPRTPVPRKLRSVGLRKSARRSFILQGEVNT